MVPGSKQKKLIPIKVKKFQSGHTFLWSPYLKKITLRNKPTYVYFLQQSESTVYMYI